MNDMLDVLFLGTGASIPSRDRSMPCVAVRCGTEIVLFDCGEGTQRQMMISPFSFMKVKGIFITHLHGDHFLGLPGLLQTMGLSGRKEKLTVYGPEGLSECIHTFFSYSGDYSGDLSYELNIVDVKHSDIVDFEEFTVSVFRTDHAVPSFGYKLSEKHSRGRFDRKKALKLGLTPGPDFSRLQNGEAVGDVTPNMVIGPPRPGCSIVYTGDTSPCVELSEAAVGADVLIHESTYSHEESVLASENKHSTAVQAAETAKNCGCRVLFLIHISNRYERKDLIEKEAKVFFENSIAPNDMDLYQISKNEIRSV